MRKTMLAAMLLLPTAASAHPSLLHHTHGFLAGVSHPLTGLDHLLAMISVGMWASQKGGRALWLWPASFVGAMIVGGGLGMNGLALPAIEPVIALSLLVLGILIATVTMLPIWGGIAIIAAFGLFHGNAHGLEAGGGALTYALGFVLSTVTLHVLGLGLGLAARRTSTQTFLRASAALIAVTGTVLLFA